jgi:glycosyltransferase 2 family protein
VFQKYKKRIIYSIVFGAIVYLGLSIYANFGQLLIAFESFHWYIFPVVLACSFANYMMRFLKWEYYTKVLGIQIERKMSFLIFLSSFIMSITPGKVGEVFKSYLLKEYNGTPITRSAPIVLAERITDFLSLVLLSMVGVLMYGYGGNLLIYVGIFFILLVVLISSRRMSLAIIGFFERFSRISKISHKIYEVYDSIYLMVKIKELIISIIFSIFAWFFECLGLYFVINNFGVDNLVYVDIFVSTFIYGFATIAGAVTMLPGGLGATDASIAFLLVSLKNVANNVSIAATLLIRIATLWFAVLVGILAVLIYQRVSHKKISEMTMES